MDPMPRPRTGRNHDVQRRTAWRVYEMENQTAVPADVGRYPLETFEWNQTYDESVFSVCHGS